MVEIGVIGINSKSCPIYLREIVTQAFEKSFAGEEVDSYFFSYVLLSTCHRVELYFTGRDIGTVHVQVVAILRRAVMLPFEHFLYSYFESDVFLHLAKVTSGFDSAIIGESEIQRQVKMAYEFAKNKRFLAFYLHYLFQKSLKIGKEIRSFYGGWKKEFQLEDVIILKIKECFQEISSKKVLFIGNSEMNRKLFALFYKQGFSDIKLCSRATDLIEMKKKHPFLEVVGRDHLVHFGMYDIVVSATKELGSLLTQDEQNRKMPQMIFDLSIPRSVDPELGKRTGVSLFNIEDVGALFEDKKKRYAAEFAECESKITQCVEKSFCLYQTKMMKRKKITSSTHYAELI